MADLLLCGGSEIQQDSPLDIDTFDDGLGFAHGDGDGDGEVSGMRSRSNYSALAIRSWDTRIRASRSAHRVSIDGAHAAPPSRQGGQTLGTAGALHKRARPVWRANRRSWWTM
jgi:hypothetical protein